MNDARASTALIDSSRAVALLEPLTELVIRAGAAILAINRAAMKVDGKLDGSPVTEADLAADAILAEGLARLAPEIPALSEERCQSAEPRVIEAFFLIDPLDGTKEFVAGRDEFTVNLALVSNGEPMMGIIGAPALGVVWRGVVGRGAERLSTSEASRSQPIRTRSMPPPGEPWVAAVSRSHADSRTDSFIAARSGAIRTALGSALKFSRVAEGQADIYPRLAPTSEWDVAAGHALVTAAGGRITDTHGAPVRFVRGRPGFIVPEFIAWGDPSAAGAQ